jgi:hypothetical protein
VTQETAAIPLPRFSLLPTFRCPDCQEGYWTRKGYKGHYSWVHVLGKP